VSRYELRIQNDVVIYKDDNIALCLQERAVSRSWQIRRKVWNPTNSPIGALFLQKGASGNFMLGRLVYDQYLIGRSALIQHLPDGLDENSLTPISWHCHSYRYSADHASVVWRK
jgi:hypothetical protein